MSFLKIFKILKLNIKTFLVEVIVAFAILTKQLFKFSTKFVFILVKTLFKTSISASAYIFLTILLVCGIIRPKTYTLIVLVVHSFDLACRIKGFYHDVQN